MTPIVPLDGEISDTYVEEINIIASDGIDIMFMMDHNYGANYHYIRPIFEEWGWNVTIAGTAEVLSPCGYQTPADALETDVLLSDISNASQFDVISIMPGDTHTQILSDSHCLGLVQSAVSEGVVVGAWCKAVRILAAADVIDGLNVTGNAEYSDEYEAAGATYMGIVPPVIQDNIVTGVRSRFYRQEMCIAIATAAGFFEPDAPEVSSVVPDAQTITEGSWSVLTVAVSDATGVRAVETRVFALNDTTGERNTTNPLLTFDMYNLTGNTYSANITGLTVGTYTIDIRAEDVFGSIETYENVASIDVTVEEISPDLNLLLLGIGGASIGTIVIVLVVLKFRKS